MGTGIQQIVSQTMLSHLHSIKVTHYKAIFKVHIPEYMKAFFGE